MGCRRFPQKVTKGPRDRVHFVEIKRAGFLIVQKV